MGAYSGSPVGKPVHLTAPIRICQSNWIVKKYVQSSYGAIEARRRSAFECVRGRHTTSDSGPTGGPHGKARHVNANHPLPPDAQLRQQERSRKRKAILAGGVVLGLGAAATLAAWSDDVFSFGEFGTGSFELQGNVYGDAAAGYENYDEANGGALSFVIAPMNMAPGDTVYAPISIATALTTSTSADVTLAGATSTGDQTLFNALRYEVRTIAAGGVCDATVFGAGTPWHAQSALGVGESAAFTVGAEQADPRHLCFAVTLPDTEANGADEMQALTTGPVVWQFTGESVPAT
ncbi:hypothetical protein CT688_14150 [Dietzia sp. JS16-p6b]|nr:hypothetical protein CT688_14150 [Dietzia sp. JS16-p6b]